MPSVPASTSPAASDLPRNVAACRPYLLVRARRLVGVEGAEDLVQDTLHRALDRASRFAPGTNLRAWLRRMMSNLAVDEWRKRKDHLQVAVDPATLPAPAGCQYDDRGEEGDRAGAAWAHLSSEEVHAAIRRLSPNLRTTFELHYQWQRRYEDIAGELRIPVPTVGTRLRRARERLRLLLSSPQAPAEPAGRGGSRIADLAARRRATATAAAVTADPSSLDGTSRPIAERAGTAR